MYIYYIIYTLYIFWYILNRVYHSVFHMFFIIKIFQRQMKKNIANFNIE